MTMREQLMASEADAQAERTRGFSMLEVYGVPRKRARSVSNGIEVLATRHRRDRQNKDAEIEQLQGTVTDLLEAAILVDIDSGDHDALMALRTAIKKATSDG